jgi:hypothetical protein
MRRAAIITALLIIMFSLNICIAQALTYDQTQDLRYAVSVKNGTSFSQYIPKQGKVLKIGDVVSIGKPLKGKIFRTLAHEKLKASEIVYGTFDYASKLSNDDQMVIEDIIAVHDKMDRASTLNVVLIIKYKDKNKFKTVLSIEKAISYGEIVI